MDLEALRQSLAADLRQNLTLTHVTTDPASVHPPCVLIGAVTSLEAVGACAWECEVPVLLVGKAPASASNIAFLGQNLGQVLTALGAVAEVTEVEFVAVEFGSGELPAYMATAVVAEKE